jgi:hypothetical protein
MATWITHLRLAENLLPRIEGLDEPRFAVGNIAPDSGIPDEKWETFDPRAELLHFVRPGDNRIDRLADLDFYRQHLSPLDGPEEDPRRFSFLLGYFFHLVTDNLWNEKIGRPTYERFPDAFEADPEFVWEVKRDWYGLDLIYVRDHPDSLFWRVFLDCTYDEEYLDFLPPEGVRQRIEYIQTFYQRTDERVQAAYERPYIYLSKGEMDEFVREVTEQLHGIYRYLWEEGRDAAGLATALALPLDVPGGAR